MLSHLYPLCRGNFRLILRDRILHAVFAVALLLLLLVPTLSSFSMRQVQELAINLSLSTISLVLTILSLLLGSSAIWRDIERRYTASVLTLPVSRAHFLLAKYVTLVFFLVLCGGLLALVTAIIVPLAAAQYPSELPIAWTTILLAIGGDVVKSALLAAIAVLFSSFGTSIFLPFFCSLAIYLAGSASQEVYEFVSGQFGREIGPLALQVVKGAYYLLPNFSAFDFKVYAVYSLPVTIDAVLIPMAYAAIYGGLVLAVAVRVFSRRQLP